MSSPNLEILPIEVFCGDHGGQWLNTIATGSLFRQLVFIQCLADLVPQFLRIQLVDCCLTVSKMISSRTLIISMIIPYTPRTSSFCICSRAY